MPIALQNGRLENVKRAIGFSAGLLVKFVQLFLPLGLLIWLAEFKLEKFFEQLFTSHGMLPSARLQPVHRRSCCRETFENYPGAISFQPQCYPRRSQPIPGLGPCPVPLRSSWQTRRK